MKKRNIIIYNTFYIVEQYDKSYKVIVGITVKYPISVKNMCKYNYFQCVPNNNYD